MSAEANVKPIRIMLKTNINGQKEDVAFTKALLSHPDYPGLSDTEGFNEYPYISDNVSIPIGLNTASYFERVQFFFDKEKFRSLTEGQQPATDESEKSKILNSNVKTMLDLLFLTAIPASANVKDSYSSNISDENESWLPNLKFTKESVMELLNTYYFSYLKIGGNEYTVNRIVWLNDVINNPMYSTLFADFEAFKTSSIGMLNKLLADKKRLFIRIMDIFKESLDDADKSQAQAPDKDKFGGGVYKSSYSSTNKIKDSMISDKAVRRSNRNNQYGTGNQSTDQLSAYTTKLVRVEEFQNKVANIGKLAWHLQKILQSDGEIAIQSKLGYDAKKPVTAKAAETQKTLTDKIAKMRNELEKLQHVRPPSDANAIAAKQADIETEEANMEAVIAHDSEASSKIDSTKMLTELRKQAKTLADFASSKTAEFLPQKLSLIAEHKKLQEAIDSFNIDRIKILMDGILRDDSAALDEPLKEFIDRLYKLNKQNKETIVAEVYRIVKNDDGQSTSNAYIKDASAKMKTFTSDERKLLPYFDEKPVASEVVSKIQPLIDNYVYNKTDDASTNIDKFITKISTLKKQNKPCETTTTTQCTDFYIGVSQLQSIDPKLPTYEITVQCDVFGGVLDATNIKNARCIFKDKKLTKQFINWRRNIKTNRLKVIPGPYFDLKDIKPKETVKQRPIPAKGGRRTLKHRRRSFKRR